MMLAFEDFGDSGLPRLIRRAAAIVLAFCATLAVLVLALLISAGVLASLQGHKASVAMPRHVDVNGVDFAVELVNHIGADSQSLIGYTDCSTRRISISERATDRPGALMHELSHATVCTGALSGFLPLNLYFNSTTGAEHEAIYHFSEMWREMLRRNPDLARYLASENQAL